VTVSVERFDARTWPQDVLEELFAEGFPEFITADAEAEKYIGRVREWFTDLNIMLVDDQQQPVATGWGVPIRWNGELADLPAGYTDTTIRAVQGREQGITPDTFVICGAIVSRSRAGQGLAGELIKALRDLVPVTHRVIAPVRPTLKPAYPLTPIDTFVQWTREDGAPLDPWLRTHWRLGGKIIATAPSSQIMNGTVAQWENWTGMALPSTGDYIIPRGLSPLHIDRDQDRGHYVEPNVWVRHR
jgi:hypothetical protein